MINLFGYFISFNIKKDFPKISIFLPIYNKGKYIKRSIESIQNQTLKDIEIIAVNDFSKDNSLNIIEELAKTDSRIKVVSNDKNHGLLYSRAMGILNSTGRYLMNLDPDDVFKEHDNLEYLYNKVSKLKTDILSFGYLSKFDNTIKIRCSNFHKTLRQPKLFESAFSSSYVLNDYLIWNKIIKREIYLYAYEIYKERIYKEKWNYHEDNIWSILVYKYGRTMKCINKVIYIYNKVNNSIMNDRYNILELRNLLYRHEMYKKIFTNKKEKKYLISEILEMLSFLEEDDNFLKLINENNIIRNQIINIFNNTLKYNQLTELMNKKIQNYLNKIKF